MSDTETWVTQWKLISHLLDEALLLPIPEQRRWLADLPAEHAPLRETLRHFLDLHARIDGEGFLEEPAAIAADTTPATMLSPGDIVGPYRVIEELGTGGMGSVWLAERSDGKPRRRLALKLPRMMWASDLSERMERERDILGSLEHPNIARLYDAGLDDQGRPYLAIEYVEGIRITHYCQENELDTRRRVQLFMQVLAAVQYAHTRLVLHRDLKPGNILVNRNGDVRLLDFGIAKLIEETLPDDEPDLITMTRALTPRYASPEQLRGERLTLVSDVYSLGVILYELLTGVSPYPKSAKSRGELELAVMEGVIVPPSRRAASESGTSDLQLAGFRLSRELRGDLDAIVMKSLSLDVQGRYASVEALTADLERWLNGRPVHAIPPSALLIARKFILRNRVAVSVAAVAVVGVLTASGIAIYQADKATAESQRAAATRDFLIDMFESANPELHGGREATVRELVSAAERVLYSSLDRQPLVQAEMLGSLVNVWLRLGDQRRAGLVLDKKIQALEDAGEIGAATSSLIDRVSLSLSVDDIVNADRIHKKILDKKSNSQLNEADEATLLWQEGWIRFHQGSLESAVEKFKKVEQYARSSGKNALLVSSLYGLALAYKNKRDWVSATRQLREARETFSASNAESKSDLVGGVEILAAFVSLGLYKEGRSFLDVEINGDRAPESQSLEMVMLYDLVLALRLRDFDRISVEQAKKSLEIINKDSLERVLMMTSILIEEEKLNDAKKLLSFVESNKKVNLDHVTPQIVTRRLRIALAEKNSATADSQVALLKNLFANRPNNDEISARANLLIGLYWFGNFRVDLAAQYFSESAKFYKERYGDRHPRFLELALTIKVLDKYSSYRIASDQIAVPSDAVVLEGLKQAYPPDHPVLKLAERVAIERELSGETGNFKEIHADLFRSLLLLS